MSYRDAMNEALASYLREALDVDAVKVLDFEEKTKSDGYCETCYYKWTACDITYLDSAGNQRDYEYYGSFAELIRGLT